MRKYRIITLMLGIFTLIIPFTNLFAFGEVVTDVSNSNPSMNETISIFGNGLTNGGVPLVYPVGSDPVIDPSVRHFPTVQPGSTATELIMTVGDGEGVSIQTNKAYNLAYYNDPSLEASFVTFTVKGEGSSGCSDTDPDNSTNIRGVVNTKNGDITNIKNDYCGEDDKTLFQAQCGAGDTIGFIESICDNGCFEGVCLDKKTNSTVDQCLDTDPEDDIFTLGKALQAQDYCGEDDKTLFQVQCSGSKATTYLPGKECPGACFNGVCTLDAKQGDFCELSDPNLDRFEAGNLKINGTQMAQDVCEGDILYQPLCGDGKVVYQSNKCLFGCSDGACLPSSFTSEINTLSPRIPFTGNRVISGGLTNLEFEEKFNPSTPESDVLKAAFDRGDIPFKDVNSTEWYFNEVKLAVNRGIINGLKNEKGELLGNFNPAGQLNAAEASKFVLQASNNKITAPLKNEKWYDPYFKVARQLNLSSQNFPPAKLVTRGEVACMIAEAFKIQKVSVGSEFNFTDLKTDHPQFACLGAMLKLGIMQGDSNGNTIRPNGLINRAEMSKMINLAIHQNNLAAPAHCPLDKNVDNIRIYNFEARPVFSSKDKLKTNSDGSYLVEVEVQLQNFALKDLTNVPIHLYRHDLSLLSGNLYKETIKEVRVPLSWQSAYIRGSQGRIETFRAQIPVPNTPHFKEALNTNDAYEYVDFSVAVDLDENLISETLDIADNILTARAYLKKSLQLGSLKPVIHRRVILSNNTIYSNQTGSSTQNLNGLVDSGLLNVALSSGDQSASILSLPPFNNTSLAEVDFPSYTSTSVNAKQSHRDIFLQYFRSLNIIGLDRATQNCINLSPVELIVEERKVNDDGRLELRIKGKTKKTGKMALISTNARTVVYMRELNSTHPWRAIYSEPHNSNDDGTINPLESYFDVITLAKVYSGDVEFKLVVDDGDRLAERFENDNELIISKKLTQFSSALQKVCTFDFQKHQDLWVMGSTTNVVNNQVELEVMLQNASGKDLKGVDLVLYQHSYDPVSKDMNIQEVSVPAWKNLDLKVGYIQTLKTKITVPNTLNTMIFNEDQKKLGYLFTAALDLVDNKIEEIDEISNNLSTIFAPIRSVSSSGDYLGRTVEKLNAAGGSAQELTNSPFAWRNWRQYFESRHKVPLIGKAYSDLHSQCTTLELGKINVQALDSTQADNVKYKFDVEILKKGAFPLPDGFTVAEVQFSGDGGATHNTVHRWENEQVYGDSIGRTEASSTLSAVVEFKPTHFQSHSTFKFRLDPDKEIPRKNNQGANQEQVEKAPDKNSTKLDLSLDKDPKALFVDYLKVNKNKDLITAPVNFKIINSGSGDLNTPVEIIIRDNKTNKTIHSSTVFNIINGEHSGIEFVKLAPELELEYDWTLEIDPNDKLVFEKNRTDNKIAFKWKPRLPGNIGVNIDLDQLKVAQSSLGGYIKVPIYHSFYNLDGSGNWNFYKNSQKFPLNPPLTKNHTVHKPHFSGTGTHAFITKTSKYTEDAYDHAVALKGGVIELGCAQNCKGSILDRYGSYLTNLNKVKLIQERFGDFFITNRDIDRQIVFNFPTKNKFYALIQSLSQTNWWKYVNQSDADINLKTYAHDFEIKMPKGKKEYIIFTHLNREWYSYLTADENNEPLAWWYHVFPNFLAGRFVDASYEDAWNFDNYSAVKLSLDGNKITEVKRLTSTEVYNLTKANLKEYGDELNEFLKQYYNLYPF